MVPKEQEVKQEYLVKMLEVKQEQQIEILHLHSVV